MIYSRVPFKLTHGKYDQVVSSARALAESTGVTLTLTRTAGELKINDSTARARFPIDAEADHEIHVVTLSGKQYYLERSGQWGFWLYGQQKITQPDGSTKLCMNESDKLPLAARQSSTSSRQPCKCVYTKPWNG